MDINDIKDLLREARVFVDDEALAQRIAAALAPRKQGKDGPTAREIAAKYEGPRDHRVAIINDCLLKGQTLRAIAVVLGVTPTHVQYLWSRDQRQQRVEAGLDPWGCGTPAAWAKAQRRANRGNMPA